MKKLFIPYELALKLKELGFNEMGIATYDEYGEFSLQDFEQNYDTLPGHIILAPLWQQAFDWFREEKELLNHITTHLQDIGEDGSLVESYGYRIMYNKDGYKCDVWEKLTRFDTHEEAREACLEKLIELCGTL